MQTLVRAIFRAAVIPGAEPPYDRVSLKIHYPAIYGDTPEERNTGVVPCRDDLTPLPVVIILPGVNLGPEGTAWLALRLAGAGYAVVSASAITEEMPGYVSVSPGLLLDQLQPEHYGRSPSCALLQPVLEELSSVQADSVLAGKLDLQRIALAGHSAGGTAALLNANPAWFSGVRAVFAYAAHTGASMALGWPADTVLELPASLPVLLLGGDRDGVIAGSAHRYGRQEADPLHTLVRTFDEGVGSADAPCWLFVLRGANHFSFAHPHDGSTGRGFIDWPGDADQDVLRRRMGDLIEDFLAGSLRGDAAAAERLDAALQDPRMRLARRK